MKLADWIPSLVSAALVLGGGGSFVLANESRLSTLENQVVALESGRSIRMADSTRERFDAITHQLDGLAAGIERLELRLDQHSERLSRIEGRLFPDKRGSSVEPKAPAIAANPELGG